LEAGIYEMGCSLPDKSLGELGWNTRMAKACATNRLTILSALTASVCPARMRTKRSVDKLKGWQMLCASGLLGYGYNVQELRWCRRFRSPQFDAGPTLRGCRPAPLLPPQDGRAHGPERGGAEQDRAHDSAEQGRLTGMTSQWFDEGVAGSYRERKGYECGLGQLFPNVPRWPGPKTRKSFKIWRGRRDSNLSRLAGVSKPSLARRRGSPQAKS